jgi:hypothetical protein
MCCDQDVLCEGPIHKRVRAWAIAQLVFKLTHKLTPDQFYSTDGYKTFLKLFGIVGTILGFHQLSIMEKREADLINRWQMTEGQEKWFVPFAEDRPSRDELTLSKRN